MISTVQTNKHLHAFAGVVCGEEKSFKSFLAGSQEQQQQKLTVTDLNLQVNGLKIHKNHGQKYE